MEAKRSIQDNEGYIGSSKEAFCPIPCSTDLSVMLYDINCTRSFKEIFYRYGSDMFRYFAERREKIRDCIKRLVKELCIKLNRQDEIFANIATAISTESTFIRSTSSTNSNNTSTQTDNITIVHCPVKENCIKRLVKELGIKLNKPDKKTPRRRTNEVRKFGLLAGMMLIMMKAGINWLQRFNQSSTSTKTLLLLQLLICISGNASSHHYPISQCIGDTLVLNPNNIARGEEFFKVYITRITPPRGLVIAWFNSRILQTKSDRVKYLHQESYHNLLFMITNLQPSDAGWYRMDVLLTKGSLYKTHRFELKIYVLGIEEDKKHQLLKSGNKKNELVKPNEDVKIDVEIKENNIGNNGGNVYSHHYPISQCIGSTLVINPNNIARGEEFFKIYLTRITPPRGLVIAWFNSGITQTMLDRVKYLHQESYRNLSFMITNLQPSDAGWYRMDVLLTGSNHCKTHRFELKIYDCDTENPTDQVEEIQNIGNKLEVTTNILLLIAGLLVII